jgi:hypothetical protein
LDFDWRGRICVEEGEGVLRLVKLGVQESEHETFWVDHRRAALLHCEKGSVELSYASLVCEQRQGLEGGEMMVNGSIRGGSSATFREHFLLDRYVGLEAKILIINNHLSV